jgi:hypothetical protein
VNWKVALWVTVVWNSLETKRMVDVLSSVSVQPGGTNKASDESWPMRIVAGPGVSCWPELTWLKAGTSATCTVLEVSPEAIRLGPVWATVPDVVAAAAWANRACAGAEEGELGVVLVEDDLLGRWRVADDHPKHTGGERVLLG